MYLRALGRAWIRQHDGESFFQANNLSVTGIFPTQPAEVLHVKYGSKRSTLTLAIQRTAKGKQVQKGKPKVFKGEKALVLAHQSLRMA